MVLSNGALTEREYWSQMVTLGTSLTALAAQPTNYSGTLPDPLVMSVQFLPYSPTTGDTLPTDFTITGARLVMNASGQVATDKLDIVVKEELDYFRVPTTVSVLPAGLLAEYAYTSVAGATTTDNGDFVNGHALCNFAKVLEMPAERTLRIQYNFNLIPNNAQPGGSFGYTGATLTGVNASGVSRVYPTSNSTFQPIVRIPLASNASTVASVLPGEGETVTYYEFTQEYPTSDRWSPIDSLVFTSTMPFQMEATGTPMNLGDVDMGGNSGANLVPSFTDFALDLGSGADDYLQKITYTPSGQYRWLEFQSSEPLNTMNFQLMWRNRFNDQTYPVYFKPSGSVSLKLLLQRKY